MKNTLLLIIVSLLLMQCSDDDPQPIDEVPDTGIKSGKTKVSLVSTALSEQNKSLVIDSTDFVWDQSEDISNPVGWFYVKVTGIRGLVHGINFMGEGDGKGSWKLFKDKNINFDLKSIQELLETDESQLDVEGHLSSLIMYVSYIDLDIQFKGIKSTLRCYYKNVPNNGAKEGDILYLDPSDNSFKWVSVEGRALHSTRPIDGVARINFHNLNKGKSNVIVFGADNFTDVEWINNPPPWSDTGHRPGNRIFYNLTEDNFIKNHDIVIDLSMMKAAVFSAHVHIKDGTYFDSEMPWFSYTVPFSGLENIKDLDGNSVLSEEFTVLDILPGLLLPYCMCNIQVTEK